MTKERYRRERVLRYELEPEGVGVESCERSEERPHGLVPTTQREGL